MEVRKGIEMILGASEGQEDKERASDIFLRRIYFERDTLNIIAAYHLEGAFAKPSVADDWKNYPALASYEGDKENIDILQWIAPDPKVEEVCLNAAWIGIRKTGDGGSDFEVFDDSEYLRNTGNTAAEISQLLDLLEEKMGKQMLSESQINRLMSLRITAALSGSEINNLS